MRKWVIILIFLTVLSVVAYAYAPKSWSLDASTASRATGLPVGTGAVLARGVAFGHVPRASGDPKGRPLTLLSINPERSRSIEFDYIVEVEDIPVGASDVKIWIPYLPENDHQIIEEAIVDPPQGGKIFFDRTYHNRILSFSLKSPGEPTFKITTNYRVKRLEYSNIPTFSNFSGNKTPPKRELTQYLRPNKLIPLSPQIRKMAAQIIRGKQTTLEKARAIYDYVFENVSYDKTIPGWGNGDVPRVCLIKRGNCTDFHSLFIALARARGIPAKFVIGFSIPSNKTEGEINGYHCWAEFYDDKLGWVPVDISEAWKDKAKRDYYFGNIGDDRLELTQGRDIVLEPPQQGEPLNYFVFPYVEVNGQIHTHVKYSFKFKDQNKGGEMAKQYNQ